MLNVKISIKNIERTIFETDEALTAKEIWKKVKESTGISEDSFYIVHNGRLAYGQDILSHGSATIVPRLLGGKGGFGSMLRAIGAQIEKTTNREACRDLSGRRLRDINEEKRLKAWIDKQGTREEEAAERKKKKLQRLCAEPKHEFKDKNYEQERSTLTEKVGDAVEEGFKLAMAAGGSGVKRKCEEEAKKGRKKLSLGLGLDIDSDELGSSDSDEDEHKIPTVGSSRDSPICNSSDEKTEDSVVSKESRDSADIPEKDKENTCTMEKEEPGTSLKNSIPNEDEKIQIRMTA